MPTALQPGENSIDSTKPVRLPNGSYALQWRLCYKDGTVKKFTTKHKGTIGDLRRKAKKKAATELERYGKNSKWEPSSRMSDFIRKDVIPAVDETTKLKERSKKNYQKVLQYLASELEDYAIENAVRPRVLEETFRKIALEHGTATARQAVKVTSKYVMERLVRDEVIPFNPLRDFTPDLPDHVACHRAAGGQALTPDQKERVIDYLLSTDVSEIFTKGKTARQYSREGQRAKQRLVVDATLLQAATGMRISEVRLLRRKGIEEVDGKLVIVVTPEESKTKKGRHILVLDERVEERLRERLLGIDGSPDALVFHAPTAPDKEWDASNAQKAVRQLYMRLSKNLDIPLLSEARSHVWRTTLNNEWLAADIPEAYRSAYLGHTGDVNQQYYTDLKDLTVLKKLYRTK